MDIKKMYKTTELYVFSDYLLLVLWYRFCKENDYDASRDVYKNSVVSEFASWFYGDSEDPYKTLRPFGIKNQYDLRQMLRESHGRLVWADIPDKNKLPRTVNMHRFEDKKGKTDHNVASDK